MNDTLVELQNVRLVAQSRIATVAILKDLSLKLRRGTAYGLVGESGSGKSMTARTILGMLPDGLGIESGTASFDGDNVFTMSRSELRKLRAHRIAWIPQDPRSAIDPLQRCGHALEEVLRVNMGLAKIAARARTIELLSEVGIRDAERVAAAYPHELSGGLLQRVVIAMGLASEPELIIADEPTTALDVTVQAGIIELFRSLTASRGVTLLFISHDIELVASLCSEIGVMYAGRLIETRKAKDLLMSPLHPYTAGLLAARPGVTKSATRLAAIPGLPPSPQEETPGCAFSPRCASAMERCRKELPTLADADAGPTQQVACWRADDPAVISSLKSIGLSA
ncbi:ABC transporter ATP-binding protein [Paenarthrobacter nicotinovorans]|uniref:ABC transporter ATP-binding protein n=1 Tax=Paenarthrobacter nicotinovorans TaxID=29320 RepID=UPI0007CC708F|nr:ABC transporter ATP-binding protein [Paenarthrobacter nicotinovorans]GAT88269.1 ABC transporter ATP-binding protein [Paenarthrobacter nicotinovorans]